VEEHHEIVLEGRPVSFALKRSSQARVARVRVSASGTQEVMVVVPKRCGLPTASRLLRTKAGWVIHHLDRLRARADAAIRNNSLGQAQLLLRGEKVTLMPAAVDRIRHTDDRLLVPATTSADVLERWFRSRARCDLEEAVAQWGHVSTRRATRITIRDQRTRWGSCSSRGTLSFNWRLVMAPPAVLDYLAIHEIAHLDVPNHSSAFWSRVESACPAYRVCRQWLGENESVLMRPLCGVLRAGGVVTR
jgi:predicted metal-dependent hydrolase